MAGREQRFERLFDVFELLKIGSEESDRAAGDLDDELQADLTTKEMLKDKIEQVLKPLTFREREIIKLRYGLGDGYTYTLEDVGLIFRVTRERVRQIEAKAVRKLQHAVAAAGGLRRIPQ
jgi:RNA polymerase primary sigma factor